MESKREVQYGKRRRIKKKGIRRCKIGQEVKY